VAKLGVTAKAIGGSVTLNIMGSHGATSVTASGDIELNYFSDGGTSSWAYISEVNSTAGDVHVRAVSGIYNDNTSGTAVAVSGNIIELDAGQGAIGTATRALTIHAREGFAAQAGLDGPQTGLDKNIYLSVPVADASLVLVRPEHWANPKASVYSAL